MFYNREELAKVLFEGLDDAILGDEGEGEVVSIDDLLTPKQKYYLVYTILDLIPKTDHEKVVEFNKTFGVDKEQGLDIITFKSSELRFRLLLEEVIELGFALGFTVGDMYQIYVELQDKVRGKNIIPSIVEVLDALTDINYVSYGAIDVFGLNEVAFDAMENVHDSNMSKLLPLNIKESELKQIVEEFNDSGVKIRTEKVEKGYVIRNRNTNKVLKPSTYKPATLRNIINKFKKDKENG